jgi:vacuolar-type H+-ATPase subunit F/Vma7
MSGLQVIGDRETVLAFALGGIPGTVARTPEETRAALDVIVAALRDAGGPPAAPALVCVTYATARAVRGHLDALALDPSAPLILEIPGFGEPDGADPVARLVGRVLGGHS